MSYLGLKKLSLLAVTFLLSEVALGEEDPFAFDLTEEMENTTEDEGILESRFSNVIEGRARKFTKQHGFLSSRLRLNSSLLLDAKYASLYVNGFFDYDESVRSYDKTTKASLYELYGKLDGNELGLSGAQLTVGKMRLSWGVNDGRSTMDVINATYFEDPLANGRTVYKWPSWLVRYEQATPIGNLELVMAPVGKDRKIFKYGSPWEPQNVHDLRILEKMGYLTIDEDLNPKKPEWGARYVNYQSGYDFGMSFYSGFTDLPVLARKSFNEVEMKPVRTTTVNMSGAMTLGSNTLRAELAHTNNVGLYDDNGNLFYKTLRQIIVGWDKNLDHDIYANVQLFWDHYRGYQDDYGFTLCVNQKYFNDALILGVNAMYGYQDEHTLETYAEYIVNDNLTLNLRGFFIGGGTKSSIYQSYDRNDYVEVGFKYFL